MRRNIYIGAALALLIVGLVLFFLFAPSEKPNRDAHIADEVEILERGERFPELTRVAPREKVLQSSKEDVREEEPEVATSDPMIRGQVVGEGEGVADATVMFFAMSEIEKLLRGLEKLAPDAASGGVPDIPRLISSLKEELQAFRKTAILTKTDADGFFELRDEDPDAYILLTYAEEWLFSYGDVVSLTRDRTQELLVELDRGSSIEGRVVDASGGGLSGVKVIAEYHPPGMPGVGKIIRRALRYVNGEFLKGPFESVSGSDGSFRIAALPSGLYDLTAYNELGMESTSPNVQTGTTDAVVYFGAGAEITVIVADSDGHPVPGVSAKLELMDQLITLPLPMASFNEVANLVNRYLGDPPRMSVSRASGLLGFRHLSAGRYRLSIEEPGFLPLAKVVEVDWGEEKTMDALRLNRGRTIKGRVLSSDGLPIPGARVLATSIKMDNPLTMGVHIKDFMTGRAQTVTNEDGAFYIAGLGKGPFRVIASKVSFGSDMQTDISPDEEPVEFFLEPGITLHGVVLDDEGNPLAKASVRARGRKTRTDSEGLFVLDGVPKKVQRGMGAPSGRRGGRGRRGDSGRRSGRPPEAEDSADESVEEEGEEIDSDAQISVRVSKKGYMSERVSVTLDETEEEISAELSRAPTIAGIVLDPEGEPAPGTLVRLSPSIPAEIGDLGLVDPSIIFLAVAVTNLEGKFSFSDFYAPGDGRFEIVADHVLYARSRSKSFKFTDRSEEVDRLEIHLIDGGTVRGKVTDGSSPIPGAEVRMRRSRKRNSGEVMIFKMLGLPKGGTVVRTNDEGEYIYRQVVPGDYTISAEMGGFTESEEQTVNLKAGSDMSLGFVLDPGGAFSGEIRDDLNEPVVGARVRVLQNTGDEKFMAQRFMGGSYKSVQSNAEGGFEVAGVPEGSYAIIASKRGYIDAEVDDVEPGSKLPTFVLTPAAGVSGFVLDVATGEPITAFGLSVQMPGDERPEWMRGFGRQISDSEGAFLREDLQPGEYELSIQARGYVKHSEKVFLNAGEIAMARIELARAARIVGRVIDRNGRPVVGAEIAIAKEPRAVVKVSHRGRRKDRIGDDAGDDGDAKEPEDVQPFLADSALEGEVKSDGEGYYSLESVPEGVQTIVVTHDDYLQHMKNIEAFLGTESEIPVVLESGFSIAGRVVDAEGQPVAGRFLMLRGKSKGIDGLRKSRVAGESGEFEIRGLGPGKYEITMPTRGKGQSAPLEVVLMDSDTRDVQLVFGASDS